jgi:hypothetical protein
MCVYYTNTHTIYRYKIIGEARGGREGAGVMAGKGGGPKAGGVELG